MSDGLLIAPYLLAVVKSNCSDLHIKTGAAPRVRLKGSLVPLNTPALPADRVEAMVLQTMDQHTRDQFDQFNEADYSIVVDGLGRFRANAFRAQGHIGLVARRVTDAPPTLHDLGLPDVIGRLALEQRGLVLVTGPTGSGKTTTLGAMVDHINEHRPVHILTIEDPVEITHHDKRATVNQREVRTDTADFKVALRSAMRQDPDVILIGEMRDQETVHAAVSAAETGHFVLSTLHTTNAAETVARIIDFFPPHEQKQVRVALSQSLKGIICQRLVPTADGQSRACAMEILVNTARVAEAIIDPEKTATITDLVTDGGHYGMQTFEQHLVHLVLANQITVTAAKAAASNPHDLTIALKRAGLDPTIVDGA